jgi:hypothetical protein
VWAVPRNIWYSACALVRTAARVNYNNFLDSPAAAAAARKNSICYSRATRSVFANLLISQRSVCLFTAVRLFTHTQKHKTPLAVVYVSSKVGWSLVVCGVTGAHRIDAPCTVLSICSTLPAPQNKASARWVCSLRRFKAERATNVEKYLYTSCWFTHLHKSSPFSVICQISNDLWCVRGSFSCMHSRTRLRHGGARVRRCWYAEERFCSRAYNSPGQIGPIYRRFGCQIMERGWLFRTRCVHTIFVAFP